MKITILGNNSAIPAHGRNPSAQVIEIRDQLILVDCGEGTQMQMIKFGIKKSRIHHIFISHLHGDHYFGLIGLINSMGLQGRVEPLFLYGPERLIQIIQIQLDACSAVLPFELVFQAISDEGYSGLLVDEKFFTVHCFPVDHRIATHGFVITEKGKGRKLNLDECRAYEVPRMFYRRLQAGEDYQRKDGLLVKNEWLTFEGNGDKRYAYCADSRYTETFLKDIDGVDVMYHESTYLEAESDLAQMRFHATALQAAKLASMAQVKQLLLGHYSSRYKEIAPFEEEAIVLFPNVIATFEGFEFSF